MILKSSFWWWWNNRPHNSLDDQNNNAVVSSLHLASCLALFAYAYQIQRVHHKMPTPSHLYMTTYEVVLTRTPQFVITRNQSRTLILRFLMVEIVYKILGAFCFNWKKAFWLNHKIISLEAKKDDIFFH